MPLFDTPRRLAVLAPAVAALLAMPAGAGAQNPYGRVPNVSLRADPAITVWDKPVVLSGVVTANRPSVLVGLQSRSFTAGPRFTTLVGTTRTGPGGRFAFTVRPRQHTVYRAIANTRPVTGSQPLLVRVRPLVGFVMSRSTVSRGALVRFRGSVFPVHDDRVVNIQKRSPRGRWVTVARARLRPGNQLTSRYTRRLRIRRAGTYRVRLRGHDDHSTGTSRERTIRLRARRR